MSTTNIPNIRVELTPEQNAAIAGHRNQLLVWENEGKAGMLLAQIYDGVMVVGTIKPEDAEAICMALKAPLHRHRRPDERTTPA